MSHIITNLEEVRSRVASAARGAGRDPTDVRLIAVSKTFPADVVLQAVEAGHTVFGENRLQEAQRKVPELSGRGLEWHLIGHLQSNKARVAAELFDFIETIDSEKIARRLDRLCGELGRRMPVLIEVNIGEEPQKEGVLPREVPALARLMEELPHLELRGLMTIPPWVDDAEQSRPHFRRLRELLEALNGERDKPLTELSMGMSGDFTVAIEEGATLVRVGTAIFGRRQP